MTNAMAQQGRWRLVLRLLLVAIVAWQLLGLASAAATRNLMFDGGMNLEVSRSIANGEGPRARYDTGALYPPGVQTKEPFLLVGAAVFKVAGVGPVQAQAANMLFLLALTVLIVVLLARASDWETGLLGAAFVLATPNMARWGLNGYGEIATTCFGLAALATIAWPERLGPERWKRPFFAGVFAALAVATKVVGVVQFAAIALVLALRLWVDADVNARARNIIRGGIAFAAGALLPIVLIEAWRLRWLGTHEYAAYWTFQFDNILEQSGATPRHAQAGMFEKVATHFGILQREFARTALATTGVLLMPLLAIGAVLTSGPRRSGPRFWLIVGLAAIACAYLPWWFAIVPTPKAWVRYLYVGLIVLAMLAAMATTASLRIALERARPVAGRVAFAVLAVGLGVLHVPFVWRSVGKLDFSPSPEIQAVQYAANLINALPKDHQVFGYGWYSAPTIQLHSDRAFLDLSDWPIGRLTQAYIVSDRAELQVRLTDRMLRRYPHRKLMRDNTDAQVYLVDFTHPVDPFSGADTGAIATHVDFRQTPDYRLVSGYERLDPTGGRYVESDSEILLRYDGQPAFVIDAYLGPPRYWRFGGQPVRGRVLIDGCEPMPVAFGQLRWQRVRVATRCALAPGTHVRVRLLLDDVFDLPLLYDRQRALILREMGFAE